MVRRQAEGDNVFDIRTVQDLRAEKLRQYDASRQVAYQDVLGASEGDAVTRNVKSGELVVTNSAIYQAIVNIPRGASLVEGMNVVRTNMEAQLNALQERE